MRYQLEFNLFVLEPLLFPWQIFRLFCYSRRHSRGNSQPRNWWRLVPNAAINEFRCTFFRMLCSYMRRSFLTFHRRVSNFDFYVYNSNAAASAFRALFFSKIFEFTVGFWTPYYNVAFDYSVSTEAGIFAILSIREIVEGTKVVNTFLWRFDAVSVLGFRARKSIWGLWK